MYVQWLVGRILLESFLETGDRYFTTSMRNRNMVGAAEVSEWGLDTH